MARFRDECRRLDGLLAVLRRNDSRLDLSRLTANQRASFDDYRRDCDRFNARFTEPGAIYAAMLDPDSGYPQMRRDVFHALFGELPTTPARLREFYEGMK